MIATIYRAFKYLIEIIWIIILFILFMIVWAIYIVIWMIYLVVINFKNRKKNNKDYIDI